MIRKQMTYELKQIQDRIAFIKTQLTNLPSGELLINHSNNRYRWYLKQNGKLTYLPKTELRLAEQLARKKFLEAELCDLQTKQKAITLFLKTENDQTSTKRLLKDRRYDGLIKLDTSKYSDHVQTWLAETYEKCSKYPEHLIFPTMSGNIVRSKSETLIDLLLTQNNIPFRYECELVLQGFSYYPDFTIMHPKTEQIIYWEHFGMMGNIKYVSDTLGKLQVYFRNQIYPGINLITTSETEEHPLTIDTIQKTIKMYFD